MAGRSGEIRMNPEPLDNHASAKLLRLSKAKIIEDFMREAKKEIPAARSLERKSLVDSLPLLIDNLNHTLDGGENTENVEESQSIGSLHGATRANQKTYSLNDLLIEYRIISGAVFARLRGESPIETRTEDLIHDTIYRGIANAAAEFIRIHSEREAASARQLAALKNKFEAIFMESPAAMALWRGKEMIFELVNPKYQAIFPERQLIGLPLLKAIPELEGQPFMDLLTSVYETGETFVGREVLARHRSHESSQIEDHYYDFTYVRIDSPGGEHYGVYDHAIDVTERVLARRALEESNRKLQRERDLRDRFVAALSHDLRTPLATAKMGAQVLSRRTDDQKLIIKTTGRIMENLDRAEQMIRDLLDAFRISAGERVPLKIQAFELTELISKTLEELSTIHGNRFSLDAEGPIHGYWSPDALRRIIENLCANAIKYGDKLHKITVTLLTSADKVTITVHNYGNPIPPEDQARLFNVFSRSEGAIKGGQRGWGLGLALVKGFAEAHGGSVRVESSSESGTTFTVTLPRGAAPATH